MFKTQICSFYLNVDTNTITFAIPYIRTRQRNLKETKKVFTDMEKGAECRRADIVCQKF